MGSDHYKDVFEHRAHSEEGVREKRLEVAGYLGMRSVAQLCYLLIMLLISPQCHYL